jgi:hypothetical protein
MSTFANVFIMIAVVVVVGTVWRFSGRLELIVKELEKRDQQEEQEDHVAGFQLPAPSENGWDNISVTPAKRRCERTRYLEWPPKYQEVMEYDLRPEISGNPVFARLIDVWEESPWGDSYQVINGTICERANDGTPSDNLEKEVVWHELRGAARYAILSAHGIGKDFFLREQERIQKALTQIGAKAAALGAIRAEGLGNIWYEAGPNAYEEQKSAINASISTLCSDESLRQFGVSRDEVFRLDCIFLLNKLVGGPSGPSSPSQ